HRDGEPAIESERGGPDVGLEIESRRPRSRAATARCDLSNLTEKTIARTGRCIGEGTRHSVRDRGIAGLSCCDRVEDECAIVAATVAVDVAAHHWSEIATG